MTNPKIKNKQNKKQNRRATSSHRRFPNLMSNVSAKVAVVGCGISGAACAWSLARNGVPVTLFESGRGPGGRMSQRREITEDGKELLFDHGAPYFTVGCPDLLGLVREWESKGLCAEWKESFGTFDCASNQFINIEQQEGVRGRYVGVPGMNSLCMALCREPGVESRFGVMVGKIEWLTDKNSWLFMGVDGQSLGHFKGVVASDKNIVSHMLNLTSSMARVLPLDISLVPELAVKLQNIPASPRYALMLAYNEPLCSIPVRGFWIENSEILSWAHCESSKLGRSSDSERWVLHSTKKYAEQVIAETGLKKLNEAELKKIADGLFIEWQRIGLVSVSQPFFVKAHGWGSAFPGTIVARAEKCLWDEKKRLAICGDFCVSPNVEGALLSGLAAASKFTEVLSYL